LINSFCSVDVPNNALIDGENEKHLNPMIHSGGDGWIDKRDIDESVRNEIVEFLLKGNFIVFLTSTRDKKINLHVFTQQKTNCIKFRVRTKC